MKKRRKFTLVELIAVVVILAIISTVAFTKIFSINEEAKRHAEEAVLAECINTLSGAYYQYLLQNNGEIPDIDTLRIKTAFGSPEVPADYNREFTISLEEVSLNSLYTVMIHKAPWDLTGLAPNLLKRTVQFD